MNTGENPSSHGQSYQLRERTSFTTMMSIQSFGGCIGFNECAYFSADECRQLPVGIWSTPRCVHLTVEITISSALDYYRVKAKHQ